MPACFVNGCKNNTTTGKNKCRFMSFPKFPSMQSKWLKACGKSSGINVKNG